MDVKIYAIFTNPYSLQARDGISRACDLKKPSNAESMRDTIKVSMPSAHRDISSCEKTDYKTGDY